MLIAQGLSHPSAPLLPGHIRWCPHWPEKWPFPSMSQSLPSTFPHQPWPYWFTTVPDRRFSDWKQFLINSSIYFFIFNFHLFYLFFRYRDLFSLELFLRGWERVLYSEPWSKCVKPMCRNQPGTVGFFVFGFGFFGSRVSNHIFLGHLFPWTMSASSHDAN